MSKGRYQRYALTVNCNIDFLTNHTQSNSKNFLNQLAVSLGCEIYLIIIIFEKTKSQKVKVNPLNFKNSLGMWIVHDLNEFKFSY